MRSAARGAGELGAAIEQAAAVVHEVGLLGEGEGVRRAGGGTRRGGALGQLGREAACAQPVGDDVSSAHERDGESVRQRLRMVSRRASGAAVMRRRTVAGGGSSRVLRRVLAASRPMRSAGSMMMTRKRPSKG